MLSLSLLERIPSSAVYRRLPLDPRLNALGFWLKAADEFTVVGDEEAIWPELVYALQASDLSILPSQVEFAREVLRQNAECLDLLDRGLERGLLQFSELYSLERVPAETDFVSRLGDAARLHVIRFRLWFSAGDYIAAGEELFRLEKIGSMICNGEGQILHYLIGLSLRAVALRGFGHLAAETRTPRVVLERILEALDDGLKSPDGLAQSLRVDLCAIALAQLDRTFDDRDLEQVVDKLLEVYYLPRRDLSANMRGPEHSAIAEGWLAERHQQILLLLRGHPHPFDKAATAQAMGTIVAEIIRDLNQCRRPAFLDVIGQLHSLRRKMRLHRLARKTRFWPVELTPRVALDTPGDMGVERREEGEITTVQLPAGTLSEARLTNLQARLRQIDNPIGLMLAEHLMAHDYSRYLLEHLKKMKTMRGLIRQRVAAKDEIQVKD